MKGVSGVEEEFDKKASSYESNRLSPWYKAQGEYILRALASNVNGAILDVGCGTGWLLRQILKAHPQLQGVGIDLSGKMIELARQRAKEENLTNLTFIKGDWESQDLSEICNNLESKRFNVIICASTLHYFADPYSAVTTIYRCLGKGGEFLLLDRAKENSLLTRVWDRLHQVLIRDHVQFYRSTDLLRLLQDSGFTEVRIISKIKKFFWKRKMFTSLVLCSAKKPESESSLLV